MRIRVYGKRSSPRRVNIDKGYRVPRFLFPTQVRARLPQTSVNQSYDFGTMMLRLWGNRLKLSVRKCRYFTKELYKAEWLRGIIQLLSQ